MADISFAGISSGMDTESIISKLMQIHRQPLDKLEQKSSLITYKKTLFQEINTKLYSFYSASKSLLSAIDDVWSLKSATSSSDSIIGVSASSTASAGVYSMIVNKLAKAHTMRSDNQTSANAPLYISGNFTINGKVVNVLTSDSLLSIQSKINATADIGVTASIVDNALRIKRIDTGSTQIILSDEISPATDSLSNSNPAVLNASIVGAVTVGDYDFTVSQLAQQHEVLSDAVADPAAALGQAGTFLVNGQSVNVIATDSLNDIRDKINAAGAGVTASVTGGNRLDIKSNTLGAGGAVVSQDTVGTVLQNIGVLNPDNITYKSVVYNAQDAAFNVDGTDYTRSSNTFSDVVSGVQVTLTSSGASTLTVYKQNAVLRSLGVLTAGGAVKNELVQAQDSEVLIDGQTVTRSTNVIDDAIQDVTLTLKSESATAVTVTVGADVSSIKSKITDWVNAYNAANKLISDKLNETTVANPKNETERQKGVVRNDYQLRQIKSDLRQTLGIGVDGLPEDMKLLDQVGIHADKNGQLTINDAELTDALNADFDKVKNLFTKEYLEVYNESTAGIATRTEHYLYQVTRALTGEMASRQSGFDNQIASLQKSIERLNTQLDKQEEKYKKQFREMEKLISSLKFQNQWMTNALGSSSQGSSSSGSGINV